MLWLNAARYNGDSDSNKKHRKKIFSTHMAPFLYLRLSNVLDRDFESISTAHSSVDDPEATFSKNWPNLEINVTFKQKENHA